MEEGIIAQGRDEGMKRGQEETRTGGREVRRGGRWTGEERRSGDGEKGRTVEEEWKRGGGKRRGEEWE